MFVCAQLRVIDVWFCFPLLFSLLKKKVVPVRRRRKRQKCSVLCVMCAVFVSVGEREKGLVSDYQVSKKEKGELTWRS